MADSREPMEELEELEEKGKKKGRKKKEKPPKEKKEKAPKKKKEKREKKEKAPKEKKGGSTVLGFLAGFLFLIVLIAGAYAVFHFNLFESRALVVGFLNLDEEAAAAGNSILNDRENALNREQADFEAERESILELEADLLDREATISQREAEADRKLEEAMALSDLLSGQVADMNKTVSLLSSMDAAEAAQLLEALPDRTYAITIFRNMNDKTQTSILPECSTEFAAEIITQMGMDY
ncbi:hypothetical protein LJC34_00765 [Oscillospiraceae bacterium OttesenSCG-928-G22]|nr:hypothetical protein [Oscillospiraceae bacterium OttesenSCG-928-G22]